MNSERLNNLLKAYRACKGGAGIWVPVVGPPGSVIAKPIEVVVEGEDLFRTAALQTGKVSLRLWVHLPPLTSKEIEYH